LYTLVMASLMITGGKIGEIVGRKRAFAIGCVIYGCGSFVTALSPNLGVLLLGWSFLEGVGAALILPAIVALVASKFRAGNGRAPTGWSRRRVRSQWRPDRSSAGYSRRISRGGGCLSASC
jgi:MFS family permease